jgi:hypothetical protein
MPIFLVRLLLWFERKVADLHHYFERPRRPSLRPGDRLDVLFTNPPLESRWVPHEFIHWADAPQPCPTCGSPIVRPRMAVESLEGKRIIVVSYDNDESTCPPWRLAGPSKPKWALLRRSGPTRDAGAK